MAGGDAWTPDALWKERRSLYTLEMLYLAGEFIKTLIGLGMIGALLIFRQKVASNSRTNRRRRVGGDSVDDPDYSHVDRTVGAPD